MKVVFCMACLVVAMAWCAPAYQQPAYTAVLLKDVPSMRFYAGQYALNTRDNTPIPQLECAYSPINDPSALPVDVICNNVGVDSTGSIVWQCDGIMSKELEFDNTQVICEGYSAPGDPYVKSGSCSLRYTLKYATPEKTDDRRNRFPRHEHYQQQPRGEPQHYRTVEAADGWSFSTVLILVLVVVVVYKCCCRGKKNSTTTANNNNESKTASFSNVNTEPSAPAYPEEEEDSGYVKRNTFAETVSR